MVTLRLRDVKGRSDVGLSGEIMEARLATLSKETADDIRACANACDTYSKKKLLVKMIRGQYWDDKLVEWVKRFDARRREFELALGIHSARAVDDVSSTMDLVHQKYVSSSACNQ